MLSDEEADRKNVEKEEFDELKKLLEESRISKFQTLMVAPDTSESLMRSSELPRRDQA